MTGDSDPADGRVELATKWSALVEAVARELRRDGRADEVQVMHEPGTLQLRARRPLSEARWEWITVNLTPDELLRRPTIDLAQDFVRAYYACS